MKKRVLAIAATAMATMMMASPVMAQDFKIGICNYVDDASLNQIVDNIQSRLEEIGKEKDVNFDVSYDNCNADANVMEQIISDFQADNVDLMVGIATPVAMRMQSATEGTDTPVVFSAVSDPVGSGLVEDLDAPGANITGTSDYLDTASIMKLIHIGQDEAVTKVSEAILRSRAGIANPNRPIGSFLFLGPTGVGKTELAKALAQALFDDERNMVRIDMTEYMEKFSVSRLIGAPPGYVGYEEGGQLTEAVRRKPYSVVLFDEVEKAHPDVFNILLQVLDDGRITDSQGRTVDFKNTVIILTSNLGSDIILNDLEQRRANGSNELSEEAKHQIDQLLKSKFRPEFLNRLDEIVYYKSLTKDEMRKIVDLQLQDLRKRMDEGKHLKLEVTTAAKDFIIDSAYDSVYGARPIKRFIQSRVETLIAKAIIQGSYTEGNTLTVDCENGALTLR